jgi:hypothetical protein
MVILSFHIRLILLFAACSSSSILLCASMKQSLWLFCFSFTCLSLFCFCIGYLPLICSFVILSGCDCITGGGVILVIFMCGVFLRSGCTGFPGQHVCHSSSSSYVIHSSHLSIISSCSISSSCALITLLIWTGRFILKYFSALSW